MRDLLDFLSLAPGQVAPNGWRTVISCMVIWRVNSNGQEDLTVDEFCSVMSRVKLQLLLTSGRSSIMTWTQGSSKDFLRPIGLERTGTFCVW